MPLYRAADREGVERAARELGIQARIEEGQLLGASGRCVFLGTDRLCRIHASLGPEHKPTVCRQWPVVALRVGEDVRVGIDPCCFTHWRSGRTGPRVAVERLSVSTVPVSEAEAAAERQVLGLLSSPGITVGRALGALSGTQVGEGLPEGLGERWAAVLGAFPVDGVAADPDVGEYVADGLRALVACVEGGPGAWPAWSAEADAWAVDAVRRFVWLRIASAGPGSVPVAAYGLLGAVAAAWSGGEPEGSGPLLAAWLRLLRTPGMWARLLPDGLALQRLLRG